MLSSTAVLPVPVTAVIDAVLRSPSILLTTSVARASRQVSLPISVRPAPPNRRKSITV
jgi:hypothetical protein